MKKLCVVVYLFCVSHLVGATDHWSALLQAQNRLAEDRARDASRKPAQVLAFSGVSIGDRVLDLYAGAGWYTELLSLAVGSKGIVYAHNDDVYWQFAKDNLTTRTGDNRLPNVIRLDAMPLDDLGLPTASVDLAFMALGYHDMFFTHYFRDGRRVDVRQAPVNHSAMLAEVKRCLKDDGVFVVIDHSAKQGAPLSVANDLHRIDAGLVVRQFEQAGFRLADSSSALRNPEDPLTSSVFDPAIRGSTDRFVYKFVKQ